MKRLSNLFSQITDPENLLAAEKTARRGKGSQPAIRRFLKDPETGLAQIRELLTSKTFRTSEYITFKIYEPKERLVFRLPYSPDRIVHHAIMRILEPIFVSHFTADTYSCLKGKGIHGASFALRDALKDPECVFFLKLDITKFYPSVKHEILKAQLLRKFKDKDLLWLLFEIIDSAPGLPIGNYLSQYLANYYLSGFDHWLKETKRVKHYFRYCDDLVILAQSKQELHALRTEINQYLKEKLQLEVKQNYCVRPASEGIDFAGYVHFSTHTLLRQSIKKNLARAVAASKDKSIAALFGWAKHCNSKNLLKKLSMTKFSELQIKPRTFGMEGEKIGLYNILNKEINILRYEVKPSKFTGKGNGSCLYMQAEINGAKRVIFSGSTILMDMIQQVPKDKFPITTTIIKENERFQFT